jgi:hypothetical protein
MYIAIDLSCWINGTSRVGTRSTRLNELESLGVSVKVRNDLNDIKETNSFHSFIHHRISIVYQTPIAQ